MTNNGVGGMTYEEFRWIPISEGPPKEDGKYLAYIVNKHDPRFRYSMTCQFINGSWCPDDECASDNVVAWMPLPEDYKESKED